MLLLPRNHDSKTFCMQRNTPKVIYAPRIRFNERALNIIHLDIIYTYLRPNSNDPPSDPPDIHNAVAMIHLTGSEYTNSRYIMSQQLYLLQLELFCNLLLLSKELLWLAPSFP